MPRRSLKPPKTASLSLEQGLWAHGWRAVFGVDEAGRGAWAGPVTAAAVCLDPDAPNLSRLEGVNDSKQLSARARAELIGRIQASALAWGIGMATHAEIDSYGIVPATCLAMRRALDAAASAFTAVHADYLLLDSIRWPERTLPYEAIVRGDQRSLSIAAASILAKVWRDDYMTQLDLTYPGYQFARHKGYGTATHRAALEALHPSPVHRLSFAPMRQQSQP